MADTNLRHEKELPVIVRDEVHADHVLFIDADGKPVTDLDMFERFSCKIPNENPDTPDRVEPDIVNEREFFEDDLPLLPGGGRIRMFGFTIPGQRPQFPAPTMRWVEGKVIHSIVHMKKNTHTIHHHGIDATNFNDGVGHTGFEVSGSYTHQFKPRVAGTYLYHCHKNTVLHFEMGMYGFLIVDPPVEGAPFRDGGRGMVRRMNDIVPYDVEALWAVDEFDTRWHRPINHLAGLSCPFYNSSQVNAFVPTGTENVGLHDFRPDVFLVSGVASRGEPIADPRVAVQAAWGDTILIRLLNAGYTVQEYLFPDLDAEVIDVDGRPLGHAPEGTFSRPFTIAAGTPFRLTTARRYSMLVTAADIGRHPFRVRFLHWISGREVGRVETFIDVL